MSIVGSLWRVVASLVVGYLLGGVPFGVLVARHFYGEDLTTVGSGNTGATNVFRTLGWRPALVVAAADIAKGSLAALAARLLINPAWPVEWADLLVMGAGVAAMTGHMFSPYFRLRGGKGVATAAGAIIVLMPKAFPVLLAVFVVAMLLTRIVSLSSMVTALALPGAILLVYPGRLALLVFAGLAVPLVLFAHRSNIGRLMRGEEPRATMGPKRVRKGD